ncbi:MAG: T9SS type A sorting domain-containing protein [Bacteroidales bacterium]|jgi:hypothetical protein|nr:T9SS type A sorting domain-containing protein [Bacteroidales bacterium]
MKKLFLLFALTGIMTMGAVQNAQAQTWQIGSPVASSVTATLSGGTLTISGMGDMTSWGIASYVPWYNQSATITNVVIQQGVTNIGMYAFYYCTALTEVTNLAQTPQVINGNAFDGVNISACTLYVPAASLTLYQNANVWQDFGNIGTATFNLQLNSEITVTPSVIPLGGSFTASAQVKNAGTVPFAGDIGPVIFTYSEVNGYEYLGDFADIKTETDFAAGAQKDYTFINNTAGMEAGTYYLAVMWQDDNQENPTAGVVGPYNGINMVMFTVTDESGINELLRQNIKVYPNPVKDELNIESGVSTALNNQEVRVENVEIVDLQGKTVISTSLDNHSINVSSLSAGVYFLKINTDKGEHTVKIVK